MEKRCRRCNAPHHDHPGAANDGGVGRLLEWKRGFCPICRDYFRNELF